VYIVLNQMPPDNLKTPWIDNVSTDALARDAFSFVLQVYTSQCMWNSILYMYKPSGCFACALSVCVGACACVGVCDGVCSRLRIGRLSESLKG